MKRRESKYIPGEYKLRARRSTAGIGLFAEEDIPKGAFVIEYTGRVVSREVAKRDKGKYLFDVNDSLTIDGNIPSNLARFINHSCVPNCETLGPADRIFIYSLKKIPAGSELTYDYGEQYFNKHIQPRGCRCPKCAKQ